MFKPVILATLLLISTGPYSAADAPTSFAFTGTGYGHGVGMSQIGAKAHAVAGESATAILNYYYKDVSVLPVVDTQTIRVNIGHQLSAVSLQTITPDSSLTLFPGDIGTSQEIQPVTSLGVRQKLIVRIQGKNLVAGAVTSKVMTVRWSGPSAVISMTSLGTSVKYRYGQIQIRAVNGALEVTNSLSVHDEYLWGISEMSSAWPAAALEAQVIASRSYALSKLGTLKPSCDCNVYSHIADQNFAGYSKEIEPKI
jgi:peptidoglycan hydrolase-like amidase